MSFLWKEFLELDELKETLEEKLPDGRRFQFTNKVILASAKRILDNSNLLISSTSMRKIKITDHFMRWLYPTKRKINLSFASEVI
jgi:hypothetical protein